MSMNISVTKQYSAGGKSFAEQQTLSGSGLVVQEISQPAGQGGQTANNTDADTGDVTADSGSHGITDGDRVDLYWSGGSRHGMTVGTVSGTTIPVDGGTGDNLPANGTDCTIAKCTEVAFDVVGDDLVGIFAACPYRSIFVFTGSDDADDYVIEFPGTAPSSAQADGWYSGENNAVANPITGDTVAKCFMSHADESNAALMKITALVDTVA